jgi:hypothetical protein
MVKNLFIKEDQRYRRTIKRKIKELLIALEVEKRYSKEKNLRDLFESGLLWQNVLWSRKSCPKIFF